MRTIRGQIYCEIILTPIGMNRLDTIDKSSKNSPLEHIEVEPTESSEESVKEDEEVENDDCVDPSPPYPEKASEYLVGLDPTHHLEFGVDNLFEGAM